MTTGVPRLQTYRHAHGLESWNPWTSGFCDRQRGQVDFTVIKLSSIVSVIQSSRASGSSPAGEREPYCTPAQIIYHCLPNTQTVDSRPAVAAHLRLASRHDLSKHRRGSVLYLISMSHFLFYTPLPLSVSDPAKQILFIFSRFPCSL